MCGGDQVDDTEEGKPDFGKPKKYDKNFKGPIKNRSCTDILCCLIFIVCVGAMVIVSAVGYAHGDPRKLVYPRDSDGRMCGVGDYRSKPYLHYFDILKCIEVGVAAIALGCPTPTVCLEKCPSTYYSYLQLKAEVTAGTADSDDYDKLICKNSVTNPAVQVSTAADVENNLIDDEDRAPYYVPSTDLVGRCIPSIFRDLADYAATLTDSSGEDLEDSDGTKVTGNLLNVASEFLARFFSLQSYGELIFKDFVNSWWLILVCLGIGAVFCFIWIVLLRWIAGIIVWATVSLFFGCIGFATYYSFNEYYRLKNSGSPDEEYGVSPLFAGEFNYYLGLTRTWLAFACGSATFLLIFLLIFLFLFKRIRLAIELIKEASRAISNMIFVLIWPVIPLLLQLFFIAYYIVSAAYVASMGAAEYYNNATNTTDDNGATYYLKRAPCDKDDARTGDVCEFVRDGGDDYIIPFQIYLLFMFFWGMNFIVALGQMTIAGSFASYYWAFEKPRDVPAFPVSAALYRSIRYHLGTLAFGSLLIAVVQIIRVFLEYMDRKLKGKEHCLARFLLKCLKCCMYCLEKFLKFITKNAYIMTAIYGRNFCMSAKEAFFLIMRNVVRAFVLDNVTDFILFISKLLCIAGVGVGAFFFFNGDISYLSDYNPELNYFFAPVIVIIIGTYLIASSFFSVYSMAVDTLFLCFLEDLEMNDGSEEKPYFMNKRLMKLMGKKNKQLKEPRKSHPAPKQMSSENIVLQEDTDPFKTEDVYSELFWTFLHVAYTAEGFILTKISLSLT